MNNKIRWIWFFLGGVTCLALGISAFLMVGKAQADPIHVQAIPPASIDWSPSNSSPLVIPAAAFVDDGSTISYFYSFGGGILSGYDCWEAPVYLPNGVRITQYNASINDTDAGGDFSVLLRRKYNYSVGADTQIMGSIVSTGSAGYGTYGDFTIDNPYVNYPNYSYFLTACGASSNTGLISVRVYFVNSFFLPVIEKNPMNNLGFNSQFNGSASGWSAAAGSWFVTATDIYTEGSNNLISSAAYVTSFTNLDYRARLIRYGCNSCANLLIIRGTVAPLGADRRWYNEYSFQYSRNGYYSVYKVINGGGAVPLQTWTTSPAINQGDAYNILRVFAAGNSLYYYINDVLVWTGTDTSLSTGRVGIGMYKDATVGNSLHADWATLYTNDSMAVSDQVSPQQQLLNDAAKNQEGGDVNHSP